MSKTKSILLFLLAASTAFAQSMRPLQIQASGTGIGKMEAIAISANSGSTAGKFAPGNDPRIVGAQQAITNDALWTDFVDATAYIYLGPGGDLNIVDSEKNNITVSNGGTGTLTIRDSGASFSLEIPVGESVQFSTIDEGGGAFSFTEIRAAVSASSITTGVLAGSLMQAAGASNSGAVTNGTQTIAGDKTYTGRQQATNQPAQASLSSSDTIVRDAVALETMFQPMLVSPLFATGQSGAGAPSTTVTGFAGAYSMFMTGTSSSAAYARLVADNFACRGGGNVPLNRSWYAAVDWGNTAIASNTDFLIMFGCTSTPTAELAARGLQAKVNTSVGATTVTLGIHNGTSLTTSTGTVLTFSTATQRRWLFRWDSSNSVFSLYASEAGGSNAMGRVTLVASATQSPGATTAAGSAMALMLYASGTPGGTSGLQLNRVFYIDK
jgi:hypothetical protein